MYIVDTQRKIYFNSKLNKLFDLEQLKYIKNDELLEYYNNKINKLIAVNESLKKIENDNTIYSKHGYLIDENGNWLSNAWDKTANFIKELAPDRPEDWIHLGVDGISAILDATGVGFGISAFIDVLHGLYYIASAFGYMVDNSNKRIEYIIMGIITIASATLPTGGNIGNMVIKKILSRAGKNGASGVIKTVTKSPASRNLLKRGLDLILNQTGKLTTKLKNLVKSFKNTSIGKFIVEKSGLDRLMTFFEKKSSKIVNELSHDKQIIELAEKLEVPIGKATKGTFGKTVSTKTAKEFLKNESEIAFKEFSKYSLKAADKKVVQSMIKETQERVLKETAKLSGKEATKVTKKIASEVAEKYSKKLGNKIPKKELEKLVNKLSVNTKIISNRLKTSMRMTDITKKVAKETVKKGSKEAVKKTSGKALLRSTRILRSIKRFVKKEFAAGMLIYSDKAKELFNSLLEMLGLIDLNEDKDIHSLFIEALKSVSDLVPKTTRKQIEKDELNDEGIKILQIFLNKFPEYSGNKEFGNIEENGILDARTITGEEYFMSAMSIFLKNKDIYGFNINYDKFSELMTKINIKMTEKAEELIKNETTSEGDKELPTTEAVITKYKDFNNTIYHL